MHHPWRAFAHLTEWTLHLDILPDGVLGVTNWPDRTVTLDKRLLQVERRCTIAHETQHILRGPVPSNAFLAAREESLVEQAAARLLIDLKALGEALAWSHDLDEVADELWVDRAMLDTRLKHLHPAERAYLKRRLEHHDGR